MSSLPVRRGQCTALPTRLRLGSRKALRSQHSITRPLATKEHQSQESPASTSNKTELPPNRFSSTLRRSSFLKTARSHRFALPTAESSGTPDHSGRRTCGGEPRRTARGRRGNQPGSRYRPVPAPTRTRNQPPSFRRPSAANTDSPRLRLNTLIQFEKETKSAFRATNAIPNSAAASQRMAGRSPG